MSDGQPDLQRGAPNPSSHGITRRELLRDLGIGAAVLVVGGVAGYEWPHATPPAPAKPLPTIAQGEITYLSRPDLVPPRLDLTVPVTDLSPGYILLTPSLIPSARALTRSGGEALGVGQQGLMLLDSDNRVVWFQPTDNLATNLQVQQYGGKPVLTYWTGAIQQGIGSGQSVILDASYRPVAVLHGGNGLKPDLHDFTLTPEGTALVTAYTTRPADLSAVGGPKHGEIFDSVAMEIDVATGKVLHEWHSADHVPVPETKSKPSKGPFDYFHINSVSLYDSEHLLISARNTWALYKVHRTTGQVVWRLGGTASDFALGTGVEFFWQHHSRIHPGSRISVFDDGSTPPEEHASRGLVLAVDEAKKTVSLEREYVHPAQLLVPFEGSIQILPDGHAFIGWGALPYFSEFLADGTLIFDGRMPTNVQSYRAFRNEWTGHPTERPALVTEKDQLGNIVCYMSWNGSTELAGWRVLMGKSASPLRSVAVVEREGFETDVTVQNQGSHLAVAALDARGAELARSATVTV